MTLHPCFQPASLNSPPHSPTSSKRLLVLFGWLVGWFFCCWWWNWKYKRKKKIWILTGTHWIKKMHGWLTDVFCVSGRLVWKSRRPAAEVKTNTSSTSSSTTVHQLIFSAYYSTCTISASVLILVHTFNFTIFHCLTVVLKVSFCSLTKGITTKFADCVCILILNKHSFEPSNFMCLDLVHTVIETNESLPWRRKFSHYSCRDLSLI